MTSKTDTHAYDGKLKKWEEDRSLSADLAEVRSWSEERKRVALGSLRRLLRDPLALHFFDAIAREGHGPSNYDPTNGLWADELLLVLSRRRGEDLPASLAEQLRDMRTGSCPQGRTHRLLQLVLSFEEKFDENEIFTRLYSR